MTTPSRETIAVALFTQLQTCGSAFKTYSRRPQLWNDSVAMPALYMGQTEEDLTYSGDNDALALITMQFPITIYINAGLDPNNVPDTLINNLLDAIDAALAPPAYQADRQDLGGLISGYCRRESKVLRVPGYLDGQGGVYFSIKVLVPA